MHVVLGATGNTGNVVAEKLLASGKKVRVLGRDAKRLERFTLKGAEAFIAEVTDSDALVKAFSGAEAAYLMVPPNIGSPDVRLYQSRATDAFASAIEKNGTKYAVVLSSFGADKPDGTGPVAGLHNLEKKLDGIAGLNVRYLRAGYFMENILPQVDAIKYLGNMAGPVNPDLRLPMIATRDIGNAAAEALLKLNFSGKSAHELLGDRDVTYLEVAKLVGAAIGKPNLSYQRVAPEFLKPALTHIGMSSNMADLLFEMAEALNSGHMRALEPRSPENTTPTTLETFVAEVFVPAYRGQGTRG
jgi:uncharacterized protein YbjT (DUF2867 family)